MFKKISDSTLPLHYRFFRKLRMRNNSARSFKERMEMDEIDKPNYAFCMYESALLAKALGFSKISVIEFGVAKGISLLTVEKHADEITKELGVQFEIYGFDAEVGLPPSSDYRDLCYLWKEGFYKMDRKKLESKLKSAKLVIGDIKDTCTTFFEKYNPAPLGCVLIDLDYYSSTKNSFSIFNSTPENYLPRIHCYFDDIVLTNEFVGELCAINEFNKEHKSKKIAKIYGLYTTRKILRPWNEQIFCLHDFEHPKYNDFINKAKPDDDLPIKD